MPMTNRQITIAEALKYASSELAKNKISDAELESEYLLTGLLGVKRHELFLSKDKLLGAAETARFMEFIKRRCEKEPAQYILGEAEFRGLVFKVTRDTLIPRPETELLADEAISVLKCGPAEPVIFDICTGSGCIAVTVAKELRGCRVYATDISSSALDVAEQNAKRHGVENMVEFLEGDLFEPLSGLGLEGKAHAILSNPPYIADSDISSLQIEVRDYEPLNALKGGPDGLQFFRRIISDSPTYLAGGGFLLMEMGYGQARSVADIAEANGSFEKAEVIRDYSGIERIIKLRRK